MFASLCVFVLLLATEDVVSHSACTDIEFGCPEGYECDVPQEGCPGHCLCREPGTNVTLSQGCPIRLRPCQEGKYCQLEPAGDCFSCNCDTPCSDVIGEFSCQPKKDETCTRHLKRGSCPVCKCDTCPPATDCPEDCSVVNLEVGCRSVCVCCSKGGGPFVLLGARSVTVSHELLPVAPNQMTSATGNDGEVQDAEVTGGPAVEDSAPEVQDLNEDRKD